MTEHERAAQIGQVLIDIKKHEEELRSLIVKAQGIGREFSRLGDLLIRASADVENSTFMSVAGGYVAPYEHLLDFGELQKLEDEITKHLRELDNLRRTKHYLGF